MCVCMLVDVNGFKELQPPSVHAAQTDRTMLPVTEGQIGWQLHCGRTTSQTHFFPPAPATHPLFSYGAFSLFHKGGYLVSATIFGTSSVEVPSG